MEAFLSGMLDRDVVLVDSDFVSGFAGLDSVLMAVVVVVVVMLSVRFCLLRLRRLRLGGGDWRVFVVMVDGVYGFRIDE